MRKSQLLVCFAAFAMIGAASAWAGPIEPGYDYFRTLGGGNSWIKIDPDGEGPIPEQRVNLVGDPLLVGANTDTIIERKAPGIAAGDTGQIDIQIVALSLKSETPIDVGGGNYLDLTVTLDTRPGYESVGIYDVTEHNDPDGGLYNVFVSSFVEITFYENGTPVNGIYDFVPFESFYNEFSHTPLLGYPDPDETMFPAVFLLLTHFDDEAMILLTPAEMITGPIVPEPGSLALLVIGVFGLAGYGLRKRSA